MVSTLENAYFTRLVHGPVFTVGEDFKFEAIRLQTYQTWNAYDRAKPIFLAKAGFTYTGTDDVVKCYSCHVSKGNWTLNMNPMLIHNDLNPECEFCRGIEGVNVPIYVPEEPEYQRILASLHEQYCDSRAHIRYASSFTTSEQISNYSLGHVGNIPVATSASETRRNDFPIAASDAGDEATSILAIGTGEESQSAPVREEFAPMKHEVNRFSSFDSNWPQHETPHPRDLARAGFYFTGSADRVQCVFCRGILRNWDEDDVPMDEHRRHFPMCPFVMGLDVGNVPDPTAVISANRTSEFMNITQAVVSDAALGIVTERPRHPQYAVEASRVSSFKNWPTGKEQTPEVLAKAGFFFAGFGDSVKCFYCDGGLRTWERGDQPWIEHARWFPRCPYVRQVKGEDFIQAAQKQQTVTTAGRQSASTHDTSPGTSSRTIDAHDISRIMDSQPVRTVLDMGLSRARVQKAQEMRLREAGDCFSSADALADAALTLPDEDVPAVGEAANISSPDGRSALSQRSLQAPESKSGCENAATTGQKKDSGREGGEDLLEENRHLKEQRQCKICMDKDVSVVFLPCGHLVCCSTCAPALKKCPICRTKIRGTVRTFMS